MLLTEPPPQKAPGQRRLLALDGGGIRGVLTLEILAELEAMLQKEHDKPNMVLSDYFDYFAGTSTGAMIATGLALGWPVNRILDTYVRDGPILFDPIPRRRRLATMFGYKYPRGGLARRLQEEYGIDTEFGHASFQSLLLVVMHNSTTDSPWPLSNNPYALYNDHELDDCNLRLPLWQIVRASTAAPVYYPPERVHLGDRQFIFVDGGITPYNNPSFQLFLQATLPEYRLGWPTGEDKLLLVSIGTGSIPKARPLLRSRQMNLVHTLKTVPGTLMAGASVQQDALCRAVGRCRYGAPIDGELGRLDMERDHPALFSYVRYNPTLSADALHDLGLDQFTSEEALLGIQSLDGIDWMDQLREVGRAAAKAIKPETLAGFKGVA
jgi:hypothetical protein